MEGQRRTLLPRKRSWPSLSSAVDQGSKVYGSIQEYVQEKGGKRVIQRILIANNGIAAVKGIRSMQKWAYETFGNENVLRFIVMATPDDIKVNAEYIHLANEVVDVPGGSNNNNYANVNLIIDIAQRLNADAVWAGWGHASENPRLPDGLAAHNATSKHQIVWIGPGSMAMRALGDKIGSSLIAQSAGVPCIGWSGTGLKVDTKGGGEIPDDIYKKACVQTAKEAIEVCRKVGYPVMIKASEGGGGKGIRMCHSEDQVKSRFGQVTGEVPGSPVFIMKLAPTCRHLEVQLLGDEWGEAIAVLGRDCSIQRRHQKIIEEGPVVAAKPNIWRHMERSAVRLAKAVGYVGAGTVEYLYTEDHKYYFLELNPRLQVEHPVTELISGVNLPAAQLQIAMGLPLSSIPHIRRFYGKKMEDIGPINFDETLPVTQPMHVIACRITAENPEMEFQPTSGTIQHLNFRSTPNVWGYFSVSSNGGVHQFADSQFGHLFATAKNRESARRNMVQALKELTIQGEIRTTVEYLRHILETEDFVENQVSTNWLEGIIRDQSLSGIGKLEPHLVVTLGALFRGWTTSTAARTKYMDCLKRGQVPPLSEMQHIIETNTDLIYQLTKYRTAVTRSGPRHFDINLRGSRWTASVEIHELADGGLLAMLDGKRYIVYGREQPDGLRLTIDSKTYMFSREYDPTRLIAEMQGKLVRYTVEDGGHVRKNYAFAEMEVMKMYIALVAPEDGTIKHCKPEGAVLEGGDLIARLDLDDASQVQTAEVFEGKFPELGPPQPLGKKPNLLLEDSLTNLRRLLSGYKLGAGRRTGAQKAMMDALRDPLLPCFQFNSIMSTIAAKMPLKLASSLSSINNRYRESITSNRFHWEKHEEFPAPDMLEVIKTHVSLMSEESGPLNAIIEPLTSLLKLYVDGTHAYAVHVITGLLTRYHDVEAHFQEDSELVIKTLRRENLENPDLVAEMARAHYQLTDRNKLVSDMFKIMTNNLRPLLTLFDPILRKLATLEGPDQIQVSIQARKVLIEMGEPTFEQRKVEVVAMLKTACYSQEFKQRCRVLQPLVNRPGRTENLLLVDCMSHRSKDVRRMAMEAYILRNHQGHQVENLETSTRYGFLEASFCSVPDPRSNLSSDIRRSSLSDNTKTSRVAATVAFFSDPEQLKQGLKLLFPLINEEISPELRSNNQEANTAYLILKSDIKDDDEASEIARTYLAENKQNLTASGIVRVTLVVAFRGSALRQFTYRARDDFEEDTLIRHLHPLLAAHIDLRRMKNFSVKLKHSDGATKLLEAIPLNAKPARDGYDGRRLFIRRVLQHFTVSDLVCENKFETVTETTAAESHFLSMMTALEIGAGDDFSKYRNNNVGVLVPVPLSASREAVKQHVRLLAERHSERLFRQQTVQAVEFSCTLASKAGQLEKILVVASNPSGYRVRVHQYLEDNGIYREVAKSDGIASGPLDGEPADTPYPVTLPFERQRQAARRVGTIYAYDFLTLFEVALREIWAKTGGAAPREVLQVKELVLAPNDQKVEFPTSGNGVGHEYWKLEESERLMGENKIAMVAWQLTVRTPIHPKGREFILIANDISVQAGSFGVMEDILFNLASKRARALRLPRLYFSVNSGARIGLAKEVMSKFQVAWNQDDISKGPKYLFLSESDYKDLQDSVRAERIEVASSGDAAVDVRYKINDIIGKKNGLGVENLSGSGLIAGETSSAYNEVFTLTYCCGRSVGIGAYLARLGQRVVQKRSNSPILLTGHFALNKLLGRRVYTSNDQLGGIEVMYSNGVTHRVCEDDLDGVRQCLEWLSYVPSIRSALAPLPLKLADPVDRPIGFVPPSGPYDTRCLISGCSSDEEGKTSASSCSSSFLSGFFDKGSFMELMQGWAKTVVCGRARLGGMACGVIAVTTQMCEQTNPADPAAPDSKEEIQQKAGQVWYPDSAFKTAQAIRDMESEDLPLIIFANWRGFSGGMRDMFDEVLKFGSHIVDALVAYKQPISVYLPPQATLRGGAWVVVDSQINPFFMRMYADPRARGGILEVEATCGIKFRRKDELATAYRLDHKLQQLKERLEDPKEEKESSASGEGLARTSSPKLVQPKQKLIEKIADREQKVLPSFHQAAAMFVDLHDTPGRMKAKGIITDIVPWEESRRYFYWNIRRRVMMVKLTKLVKSVMPTMSWFQCEARVKALISGLDQIESDDQKTAQLLSRSEPRVKAALPMLKAEHFAKTANDHIKSSKDSGAWLREFLQGLNLNKDQAKTIKDWANINL